MTDAAIQLCIERAVRSVSDSNVVAPNLQAIAFEAVLRELLQQVTMKEMAAGMPDLAGKMGAQFDDARRSNDS